MQLRMIKEVSYDPHLRGWLYKDKVYEDLYTLIYRNEGFCDEDFLILYPLKSDPYEPVEKLEDLLKNFYVCAFSRDIEFATRAFTDRIKAAVLHENSLTRDDVLWIVNDNAELGVMVKGQPFFLYKGRSLVYHTGLHGDGTPLMYRPVFKREFGEVCRPLSLTVSVNDSKDWKPLPPTPGVHDA